MLRYILLVLISLAILFFAPFFGREIINFSSVLNPNLESYVIFWSLRLPNTLLAFLVGAILSTVGLLFQILFRNDLATPYTLGVASGASFGAVFAITFGFTLGIGSLSLSLFSLIGAFLAIALIFLLSQMNRFFDTNKVLLSGVSVGLMFSSFILLFQFLNLSSGITEMIHWLMGNVSTVGYDSHTKVYPVLFILLFVSIYYGKSLELITLNPDIATSRGVDVVQTKKVLFIVCSVAVAMVVSEVGPIGFVGLVIPHVTRRIVPSQGVGLLLMTPLIGGTFLSVCELISRSILPQGIVPLGIVTSLIGTPIFIYLLNRRKLN